MKKEMLINVAQPEECRIAVIEDGLLEDLYIERASQDSYVGNIYKGKIVNIEPSIQAVFVDFGIGRNGFLHVSDVDPVYYKHLLPKDVLARFEDGEDDGPPRGGRGGPPRDRGGRGGPPPRDREPKPMTTWLKPAVAAPAEPMDDDGFGGGLSEEFAPPPPLRPMNRQAEVAEEDELPPPLPKTEARWPAPVPAPAEPSEDDGFGAGLDEEIPPPPRPKPSRPVESIAERTAVIESHPPVADDTADDSGFGAGLDVDDKPAAEQEAKKPRPRRTAKKKADDAEPAPEADAKKPRPRKKKKAEGEDGADESADDKPKFMGGAEHRTTPGDDAEFGGFGDGVDDDMPQPAKLARDEEEDDDEVVVKPLFGDGTDDDFDPDAPNDRFSGAQPPTPRGKPVVAAAEPEEPDEGEGSFGGEEEPDAEEIPVATPVYDDEEFAPTLKDDSEYGRPRRGGGGGGGGGRGGPRGGPRDRGPGGPRGGPGGGRGGPPPGGRPGGGRDRTFPRLPIEKIFKKGQEVIVQVIKEGIGTKGPTLSTFVSIAGRYLVLMPSLNRFGVSRKIEDHEARRRLRDIMTELNPPKGVGFIVRTAAIDRDPTELQNDLAYLLRLWQVMVKRIKRVQGAVEIYRESDIITRTIRDNFTGSIDAVYVDDPVAYQHASEFMQVVMPKYADRIKLHDSPEPLFHRFRLDDELAKINQKRIDMPQGGSIIIEQTEALVAIDVNSGNFRADNDAEETAYRMNMLAAKEIARQLRLRDLGGVIVNDFIDMRSETHRRNVEDALRDALKRDKARTKILRISQFGIIEMTRQRMQPSLKKRVYNDCPACKATGYVKTNETMGIEVMRMLQLAAYRAVSNTPPVAAVHLTVHNEVAFFLLNRKRRDIAALEDRGRIEVTINGVHGVSPDLMDAKCYDANGNEVRLMPAGPPPRLFGGRPPRHQERRYPAPVD